MHSISSRCRGTRALAGLLAGVAPLLAQGAGATQGNTQGTTITGHVTTDAGAPLPGATVSITGFGLGSTSRDDDPKNATSDGAGAACLGQ